MDRYSLQRMALRAFDLSERSVRRGRDSQRRRVERWQRRFFMICQAALTAGVSWGLARWLLGDPSPVFAPVAAMITVGSGFGQRVSRAVEVAVGVALGVFFGDVFINLFGTGIWQIVVVCVFSMSVATWLGARNLMITQAGVQAVMVMTLLPGVEQGFHRWLSALIGCGLALVVTLVAPSGPLQRPRLIAAEVLMEAADTLDAVREALAEKDPSAGDRVLTRARRSESKLDTLNDAVSEGMAVVRYSPFQRQTRPRMQDLKALVVPLDRLTRNLRVLARRSAVALYRSEPIPPAYLELMGSLAEDIRWCARELHERRLPTGVQARIARRGAESSHLRLANRLSTVVLLAQMRSIMVDLLEISGMDHAEAMDLIPDMD